MSLDEPGHAPIPLFIRHRPLGSPLPAVVAADPTLVTPDATQATPTLSPPVRTSGATVARSGGIEVTGLVRRYGSFVALDGIDLTVRRGEIVALLGENGAGKSTLIRVIATTLLPHAGRVLVDGHDVSTEAHEAQSATGLMLSEERSFFWRLSGRQNLEFFAALRGIDRREARRRAETSLAAVNLAEVADRRVDRYSTGMRARLSLARAFLDDPTVLLLDEPTRSLDAVASSDVRTLVRRLAAERSAAVLFATHDLHEVAAVATRTVVLSHGRVVTVVPGGTDAAQLERALMSAVRSHEAQP